ncbi:CD48 antigen-like [Puntigrus tetrazona]|uniref:CD48 antigen-like n=1 Tax=Puntigrus tetrazona TaxID=1606681 RepID=UPI001C89520F|nr:CD48 antigen-like [Puntigrus tetrazona]
MDFRLLLIFVLSTHITVFSAEISVFVQTGNSVELCIQTLPEFDDLSWRKEKSEIIVRYTKETKRVKFYSSYKDRVDFNDKTFSLTLKNMQETDSGLYTARASGASDNDIVTYRVSVIDSVEAPVLTVNSSWFSPDPCSFMCKGGNIIISSIFNSSSCSPEEVTSLDNYTLRLNCSGDSIVCNYSNPVSWKTNIKKANELCTANQKRRLAKEASLQLLWLILLLPIFVGLLALVIKKKEGAQQKEQTVYVKLT